MTSQQLLTIILTAALPLSGLIVGHACHSSARLGSHCGRRPASAHCGDADRGVYVAIRAHTPGMHPNRALSGGRRNGLGARGTFVTDCQRLTAQRTVWSHRLS